jgi:DNA-binding MarR family transcriptional regulator
VTLKAKSSQVVNQQAIAASRIEGLGFLMADVTRLLRKGFDRKARAIGLTRPQWRVLVYIIQNEGLSQSALAKSLELERAPLGQLVKSLEAQGLVHRQRSDADQREWLILPGHHVTAVIPDLLKTAQHLRRVAFQGISRQDQITVGRVLEIMRSNLSFDQESG